MNLAMTPAFSYPGLATVIFLMLVSFFVQWIYAVNVRIKYDRIQTTITDNAVRTAKRLNASAVPPVKFFARRDNYWLPRVNEATNQVGIALDAFTSASVFYQVNALFRTNLLIDSHAQHKKLRRTEVLNIHLTWWLTVALFSTLMASWYVVAIVISVMLIGSVFGEHWYTHTLFDATYTKTQKQLTVAASTSEAIVINKCLRYQKFFWWRRLFVVHLGAFVDGFALFMQWGKDE